MRFEDYAQHIAQIMQLIKHDLDKARHNWPSAARLADDLLSDNPANHDLFDLLEAPAGAYLRISPAQVTTALRIKQRRREAIEREEAKEAAREATREAKEAAKEAAREAKEAAKEAAREAKEAAKEAAREAKEAAKEAARDQRREDIMFLLEDALGGVPATEREYVSMKLAKDGVSMTFDRQFHTASGERRKAEQVSLDLHLTAADLSLVKPRGDLLSATNIERAFGEWCIGQRQACIELVCDRIMTPAEGVEPEGVILAFEAVCGYYFKEPIFAARAIQKMIWQVKRMMKNLPVEQRHMCVFLGEQNCGKTFVQRMITAVIREVVAEASLKDVLDERQMDLPEYLIILLDELVSADRADSAALKNFITGQDWSRRPMRTNVVEKVKLRASLFGTSNHSLGKLIFDSTGMRRFIELAVRSRAEIEPNWQAIVGFDWLSLWQSVDIAAEDPLMAEFADALTEKQEDLRNADNVETWLNQFEPERINVKHWSAEYAEWHAQDLYTMFRQFEEQFDRGYRGTSLTRWGRDMKSLIDNNHAVGWTHYKYGAKTVYRIARGEEKPETASADGDIRDNIRDIWKQQRENRR